MLSGASSFGSSPEGGIQMVHRWAVSGYWGVNVNYDRSEVIVLTGCDTGQARVVLSVAEAEEMIAEIRKQIDVIKESNQYASDNLLFER
jgi:hypothetical protein